MNGLRLNKALALAGLCSRRKADELIRAGVVAVNGLVVTEPGTRVDPARDRINARGSELNLPVAPDLRQKTYLLLHKPIHVISTASDPQGRPTVLDLVPARLRGKRLYPVGRLDYFSEGLLLLTDDGDLAYHLTHPRYHVPRQYEVFLRETPTLAILEKMRQGMTIREGHTLAPIEAELTPDGGTLLLTLYQGVNRQLRSICRDLGLTILTLRRIRLGPLLLGDLPKGGCRPLHGGEIGALRQAAGMAKNDNNK